MTCVNCAKTYSLFPPQTMVTPLTEKYFGYGELENSVMYSLCGLEVIAGFLLVRWLSGRFSERVVLAIGLTICNISGVWCLIFLANPLGRQRCTLNPHYCYCTSRYLNSIAKSSSPSNVGSLT